MFDNILNWRLLEGSHKFPGPDGGTCPNEAAVVAAGFKYREIGQARDCPRCFSRPISAFVIQISDAMTDELRQELMMPFVIRLAGTRDKPSVEMLRGKLMVVRTICEVLPIILRFAGLHRHADQLAALKSYQSAAFAILDPLHSIIAIANPVTDKPYRLAVDAVMQIINDDPAEAADNAATAIAHVGIIAKQMFGRADIERLVYTTAVSILDEAIQLGNQATPVETALVVARMNEAKQAVCV